MRRTFFLLAFLVGLAFGVAQSQNIKVEPPQAQASLGLESAVTNVANSFCKAVVSISTEHTTKIQLGRNYYFGTPFGGSPFAGDEYLRKFFDDFFEGMPDREFKQKGLGSGVIIDPEGYILTNEHVINGADKINVTLPDGRNFKAELKGRDARSDLAVIKINAHNLPVASLGNSESLKIGQWVVAIGNPFGFAMENPEPTVTVGVISALRRSLGRSLAFDRDYNDLVQTDAAINHGNSGGPLVNLKGEVVGINVAIFSTTGGYQGVGFAIPINNAKRILTRLMEGKKIVYGWLGITVQDLNDDLASFLGLTDKAGVLVAKVLEGGPAQKAGIKESDVIKQIDNQPINSVKELLSIVGKSEAGRKIKLKVIRDKKEINLDVEIGQRPQHPGEEEGSGSAVPSVGWRGLEVDDLTSQNAGRFRSTEKKGVIIADIKPNTPADESDLVTGDVILEINKQPVNNIVDYNKITSSLKGNALVRTARGYFVIKE